MKTPSFWRSKNIIAILLLPFSGLYFLSFLLKKSLSKPQKINIASICIGNIIAGGSGKTPVALALGKLFHQHNIIFSYLTRGYLGNKIRQNFFIKNQAKNIADEALLLNQVGNVAINKNRYLGAEIIQQNQPNCQAIILDDGLQNFTLQYSLKLLVIDGFVLFGNKFLLPAGPLRQSITSGLNLADAFVVINQNQALHQMLSIYNKPIFFTNIIIKNIQLFQQKKLFAFCGLAYPEKFFQLLKQHNLQLLETKIFADHYSYSDSDLHKIINHSQNYGLTPITTKKDWVKFSTKIQQKINYLDIELIFDNPELLIKMVKNSVLQ
jgi:tetraacyldisaccharide 4'-kinase